MKNTNRLFFALLAAAALLFAAGCSDSSDDDSDTITATAETITASELEGTSWQASYGEETVTLKFDESGKELVVDMGDEFEGLCTYTVSGSTVTIYKLYETDEAFMQLTYSSGKLTGLFNGVSLTYTKS